MVALRTFGLLLAASSSSAAVHTAPQFLSRGTEMLSAAHEACALPEDADLAAVDAPEASLALRGTALPGVSLIDAKLVFLVHRKTGYVLSGRVSQCINNVEGQGVALSRVFRAEDHWPEDSPTKLIHMSREPLDLLVSSYLYDKITSREHGTLGPGSALKYKRRVQRQLFEMGLAESKFIDKSNRINGNESSFMNVSATESLREFLVRVPPEVGMRATVGYSWNRLAGISTGRKHCKRMEGRCTQIFLNDIMNSTEQFTDAMRNILEFAGIEAKPEIMDCIAMQDTHNEVFAHSSYAMHCSARDVTKEQRDWLKNLLIEIDDKYYRGVFQAMSAKWLARSRWTRGRGVF